MKKFFKFLMSLIFIAIVLIIIAVIAVPMFVDPNDFKDEISNTVQKETGRSLNIEGDMSISVFPWLGLQMGSTSLGNAKGFAGDTFASVEKVDIRVKIMPLLKREIEMDTVTLHGLNVNLAKNKKGATNWDDLLKGKHAKEEVKEHKESNLAALAIGGLDIKNARIQWDDVSTNQKALIENLSIQTGAISSGQEVPLVLKLDFDAEGEQQAKGDLSLEGNVALNSDTTQLSLNGLKLKINANGKSIPVENFDLGVDGDVLVDIEKQTLSIPAVNLSTLGMVLKGALSAEHLDKEPVFNATLKVDAFNPKALLSKLGQKPIKTADPKALESLALSARFYGSAKSVSLESLKATLDETTLDGYVKVADFNGPDISFDLNLDKIDLDRYMPPVPSESTAGTTPTTPASPATAGVAAGSQLPVEALRKLKANGRFHIADLKIQKLTVNDINITLKAAKGVLRLDPMDARMYDGVYSGNVKLDVRGKTPKVSVSESLSGIQAGPLLKDLLGREKLVGTGNTAVDLDFTGLGEQEIRRSLNGTARFSFLNGAIKGVNIASLIRKAKAALKGKSIPDETGDIQTDFSEMSGSVRIVNGLIKNDDLSVKSPLLRLTGKGDVNLVNEKIDYTLTTKIVNSTVGVGGKDLKDLEGLSIPVKVSGTFEKPEYAPALDEVLKSKVEKKIKKKLNEKVEKALGDKLDGKAGKLLKGLFGR